MVSLVNRGLAGLASACLLAAAAAGCGGSSPAQVAPPAPGSAAARLSTRLCFRHQGYSVVPDTVKALGTAPANFEFLAVWSLLNTDGHHISLAVTFSRTVAGATRAAAWTRKENSLIGKGAVKAPVVQFGKIDVLWTTTPTGRDTRAVYGCVRTAS